MNMRSHFAHAKNMSQGKKRKEPNERQTITAALWLIGCIIVSGIVVATLNVVFGHRIVDINQSSDTSQGNSALHSLALALSSGKEGHAPL